MKNEITVCVVAYNRPKSLIRLLDSLSKANYLEDSVRLHISIDCDKNDSSENKECIKIANQYHWKFGDKIVDVKKENLGLRKHILSCGKLTEKYNNLILFEDDIVVSPRYYMYARQVLNFYKDDDRIAGFGIYSFPKNQANYYNFIPLKENSDVYFMQYACSWGQMWTKNQWSQFEDWYEENKNSDLHSANFPSYIANWKNSSWLKYYMKYVVEKNKYFVYPYQSFSTNFSDIGTHNEAVEIAFQVPIEIGNKYKKYDFETFDNSNCIYDVFFENIRINSYISNINEFIECDFYTEKIKYNSNYILTTKKMDKKIIHSYGLSMYPYELNVINNVNGNDLFLYDMNMYQKNNCHINNKTNYLLKIGFINKKTYLEYSEYLKEYGKRFRFRETKEYIKKIIKEKRK